LSVVVWGETLVNLAVAVDSSPQSLATGRVRDTVGRAGVPSVAAAIARVEARVNGEGRLLVRYSGTEPLLRVMLEGRHEDEIRAWAQEIVDVVKRHLG